MDLIEIGVKLRGLRKKMRLTQEELAEKMGMSPQAISKWENGHCLPETAVLPKLTSILNTTIDDMLIVDRLKINTPDERGQKTVIIEPKIIRKGELKIAGALGDGGMTSEVWDRYMQLKEDEPLKNKKEDGGYEVRMYNRNEKCECLVGESVTSEVGGSYSYLTLPDVLYAVFEIYPFKGYESQNEAMDKWLKENRDKYEEYKSSDKRYVIEYYDERFKGNEDPDSIVEIWIPVIKL